LPFARLRTPTPIRCLRELAPRSAHVSTRPRAWAAWFRSGPPACALHRGPRATGSRGPRLLLRSPGGHAEPQPSRLVKEREGGKGGPPWKRCRPSKGEREAPVKR
jgi:hypothetical protein